MRATRLASLSLMGTLAVAAACGPARATNEPNESGVSRQGGAFILEGAALQDGAGSVLAAMAGKVPNFRMQRNSGRCPIITLRNHVSFQGVVSPHVYVDGTRATDTCILQSLRTLDVERVEVYA